MKTRRIRDDHESHQGRRRAFLTVTTALVLSAALVTAALAASTNFAEFGSSPVAVGDSPFAVAAADLDGDTDQDLAVANAASDNVTILKNGGSGNFNQPGSSPETAGDGARSVVAADLDGDADQDLAVANPSSDNVTILLNTGSGNFTQPASSPETVGDGPITVTAANLDGDTDVDLAVANFGSGNVTVLRNNGSGNFAQPASSPEDAESLAFYVIAADLDGDTDQDLAVANLGAANVTILKNNGSSNFGQPASSPVAAGPAPGSIAAADLDGDTDVDLAVGNSGASNVTILRNNGAGTFIELASSPEPAGSSPISIAAADFDLDSDQDLAVANNGTDNVTILRNGGGGNFSEPASSPEAVGDNPRSVAAADLDGDTDLDLAIVNAAVDNMTLLRNVGTPAR